MGQPNLNEMMKQVQKMQADMAKAQEELKDDRLEASAGGGMVKVVISGDLQVQDIFIEPDVARGRCEVEPALQPKAEHDPLAQQRVG